MKNLTRRQILFALGAGTVTTAGLLTRGFRIPTASAKAKFTFQNLTLADGATVSYYFLNNLKGNTTCKILLALPPGGQTKSMVREGLETWIDDFIREGWAIISPAAPSGGLFTGVHRERVPEILENVRHSHKLPEGKVCLFGISNGGKSALEVAAYHPELFHSITVLPGTLRSQKKLESLKKLPVNVIVGENDGTWTTKGQKLVKDLTAIGGNAALEIVPGAGHYAFQKVTFKLLEKYLLRDVCP